MRSMMRLLIIKSVFTISLGVSMFAYFAGGCFWCITPPFKEKVGVSSVISGYCGGDYVDPTYKEVKAQLTDHRETIRVEYDSNVVSFSELLEIFLNNVDPYDGGGQFIDRGHSYTLAVYYNNDEEKDITINRLAKFDKEVFISVEPLKKFYTAEEYHQDYYLKNPEAFEKEMIESGRRK